MKISIESLIDKQVFVLLRDVKVLEDSGITKGSFIGIIRGSEERQGIWVEMNSIKCPVKVDGTEVEECTAIVFIPWHHVLTIMHLPGKKNLEISEKEERKIGFRQK